jgi:flagellar biosynthetic protein FliQ
MSDSDVINICLQAMVLCAKLAAPFLLVTLGIGLAVGVLQSVTQLQEPTLTFVPKFAGAGVVLLVGGSWMIQESVAFTQELFRMVPSLIGT